MNLFHKEYKNKIESFGFLIKQDSERVINNLLPPLLVAWSNSAFYSGDLMKFMDLSFQGYGKKFVSCKISYLGLFLIPTIYIIHVYY